MEKTLIFIAILFQLNAFSQASDIEWQKTLGGTSYDGANCIQLTADGGYITVGICGSTDGDVTGNHGSLDYWVVKLNKTGTIQWQKSLGGSGYDSASSVQQTSEGGYVVAGGSRSSNGDVTGNHGSDDYWIIKLNSVGEIEWQKSLGGSGRDFASNIQQTKDGGYIVAGETNSTNGDVTGNHGSYDYWVVKLNLVGAIEWQKTLGNTGVDFAHSVKQTKDGGYIVAGETSTDANSNTFSNYLIVKLNSLGVIEWQKTLGGSGKDSASSIEQTSDGGYIVSGVSNSTDGDVTGNHGSLDYWVVKLNSLGTLEWQKTLGGSGYDSNYSNIQQSKDGGYILAGATESIDGDITENHGLSDFWVVKLNSFGTLQWQKTIGGTGYEDAYSIQQSKDGGYILAGATESTDGDVTGNHGSLDYWIVKLSPNPLEITTFNQKGITLSQNPTNCKINLQFSNTTIIEKIIVTDLTGKKVLQQNQFGNQINIEHLANGTYILQAFTAKEKFQSKFVKE